MQSSDWTSAALYRDQELYSDAEAYCSQLLRRGRGFPLYVPEPQANLPEEYQRSGVAIGDVGRITPEGVFDFFFNIYLPADHPIHANYTPDNFVPLDPFDERNVTMLTYVAGDCVSTASVSETQRESPPGTVTLHCKPPHGAVLTLPLGSRLEKLEHLESMRIYAAKHAQEWYKYANGARGRGLTNGSLYLVTGMEKSLAWGMAAFDGVDRDPFDLCFHWTDSERGAHCRWIARGAARTNPARRTPRKSYPLHSWVLDISRGQYLGETPPNRHNIQHCGCSCGTTGNCIRTVWYQGFFFVLVTWIVWGRWMARKGRAFRVLRRH
ncbi:hypothetical protein FB45DRAFT_261688 [Roridomyces roridus]|uniref:Uncharacterized protein n=1 Tax=Roridomyces roridus TaxID=1738132 RepID=A0AAD7FDN0_9AGAR|nr:hypothetical protein FB45DRAFT_261688 [Roridomyces roridus]